VLNLGLNLALVLLTGLQEAGLALATAVCAAIQCLWLAGKLGARIEQIAWSDIARSALRTAAAAAVMAVAVLAADRVLSCWPSYQASALMRTVCIVVTGAATFGLVGVVLRIPELRELVRRSPARREPPR